jgi:hypothetical protein
VRKTKTHDGSNATRPFGERVQLAIFLSIFVVAFCAVADIFGALPIAHAIATAWRATSLIEVSAWIDAVQLRCD